jgi:outer membrane protein TolC
MKRFPAILGSILLYMFFLPAPVLCAQSQPRDIGLNEAVAEALRSNPDLARLRAEAAPLARAAKTKKSWLIPTVGLEAAGRAGAAASGTAANLLSFGVTAELALSTSMPMEDRLNELSLEAKALTTERERQRVARTVSRLFFQVLLSDRKMAAYESFLASANARLGRERDLLAKGFGTEYASLVAESSVIERRAALDAERAAREVPLRELRDELGLPADTILRPVGDLDATAAAALEPAVGDLGSRPDKKALAVQVEIARHDAKKTVAARKGPRLQAAVGWLPIATDPLLLVPTASLRISMPLEARISGSAGALAIEAATDGEKVAELAAALALTTAAREAENARAAFGSAKAMLALRERGAAVAEQRYQVRKRLYDSGIIDSIALADSEDENLAAILALETTVSEVYMGQIEVAFALGLAPDATPFPGE